MTHRDPRHPEHDDGHDPDEGVTFRTNGVPESNDPRHQMAVRSLTAWSERGDLTSLADQWERRCNREGWCMPG